ncbi:uncharacterized protein LOC113231519 [Hyposmocoma kahamanoa]|uniref:uncharacterized protein LOC113231519 n=1 Tax=Hyposmocoma kahamanoa TaxID=1477025 RepID=UPI000E6D67BC|nr:uncharacterized protein LOC113231519 [Hyposmocoma kahamanoa]
MNVSVNQNIDMKPSKKSKVFCCVTYCFFLNFPGDGFKLASSGSGSPAPPPVQWRVRRKPGNFFAIGNVNRFPPCLQLRSIEEPGVGAGGVMPAPTCYDAECARTEAWLDENQDFVHDYFLR